MIEERPPTLSGSRFPIGGIFAACGLVACMLGVVICAVGCNRTYDYGVAVLFVAGCLHLGGTFAAFRDLRGPHRRWVSVVALTVNATLVVLLLLFYRNGFTFGAPRYLPV